MQESSPLRHLDEWARRKKIFIEYRLEKESNLINGKIFTVRLQIGEKFYFASGKTIKAAQTAAAQTFLMENRSISSNCDPPNIHPCQSAVIALNNWASRNHLRLQYVFLDEKSNNSRQIFFYRLYLPGNLYFDGHGYSHQQARSHCALTALYFLRQNSMSPPSTPQSVSPSSSSSTSSTQSNINQPKSTVSLLYERAKQLGLTVRVEWNDALTVTYRVGEDFYAKGQAATRNLAKHIAAEKLLRILPSLSNEKKSNPIARLYQLAQNRRVSLEFVELESNSNQSKYRFQVKFDENHSAEGFGSTKQLAKRTAAETLLEQVDPVVVLPAPPLKGLLKRDGSTKQEKKHVHFVEEVIAKDEELSKRSSALVSSPTVQNGQQQQLIETCGRLKIQVHFGNELNQNDSNGSSRYQSMVTLSNENRIFAQFRGQGPTAIRAQENASSAAWNHLKQLFNKAN